ncbi:MAG: tetratricopeptide repeat protein [Chloroflexia bacterium]
MLQQLYELKDIEYRSTQHPNEERCRITLMHTIPTQNSLEPTARPTGYDDTARSLPAPLTLLVGRDAEARMACSLLIGQDTRLLTITGSPGIGKTRLALRVAHLLVSRFRDGVYFVPLANVHDAASVVPCIARALGLNELDKRAEFGSLRDYLRGMRALLILDNFEQVPDAALFVADLMEGAPGVRVLVTSRTLLNVYGEHALPVPPLAVPPIGAEKDIKALGQYESVILFVTRAIAARPDFALTEANAAPVAEICRLLDGVPLAIELAAARTRVASAQAILERLRSEPLHFLKGGAQNSPLRQQTLREAIGWSYNLLTEQEQTLLRRLSLFSGGCTLEGAEAVLEGAGDSDGVSLELLESLLAKSLLSVEEVGGEARFTMLNTVREYALERLEAENAGEAEQARMSFVLYYLRLAEAASVGMYTPEQALWLNRLESEHYNLRTVLKWITDDKLKLASFDAVPSSQAWKEAPKSRVELALRLSRALWLFWEIRGYLNEGYKSIMEVLDDKASLEHPNLRAKTLGVGGRLALILGDLDLSRRLYAESLMLSKQTEDAVSTSFALTAMGHLLVCAGDLVEAEPYYTESLALRRVLGQTRWVVHSLVSLGDLYSCTQRFEESERALAEGLELAEMLCDKNAIARLSIARGHLGSRQRDYATAEAYYLEGIERFDELKSRHGRAECVAGLAEIAYRHNRYREAALLFGWVYSVFNSIGSHWDLMFHIECGEIIADLRVNLGSDFARLESVGAELPDNDVLTLYLGDESEYDTSDYKASARLIPTKMPILLTSAQSRTNPSGLTVREMEVLKLVAGGLTNAEAAERLIVSPYTVNMHLRSIYHKLGVSNRNAATRYAVERHIV